MVPRTLLRLQPKTRMEAEKEALAEDSSQAGLAHC